MRFRMDSRDVAALRRSAQGAAAVMLVLATAHIAAAGACGDDVGGKRVPCACGDNVVSDTTLWPTDPVATETCSGDGLILMASKSTETLTLHLGGQSIAGRGRGTGIRVARGGSLGAVIVGGDADDTRAEIAHFDTGIRASGRDVLREVRAVDIHDNRDDGLSIHASGVVLDDVRSDGNGRNGIALSGHGNEVSGVAASGNVRDGLKVRGSAATVDAQTDDNGRNGADIGGRGNHVEKLRTARNGGAGVVTTGSDHDLGEIRASENAGGTIAGRAGAAE